MEMILTAVSYERKNIICCYIYGKNLRLTKNNTFNNVFRNKVFSYCRFLPIFQKRLNFHE